MANSIDLSGFRSESIVMEFRVPCECGKGLTINEGAAGATLPCECGRPVRIPSLKDLRVSAGLPAYDLSPELLVEHLLAKGGFEFRPCLGCGSMETSRFVCLIECERARVRNPNKLTWKTWFFYLLHIPLLIYRWDRDHVEEGRDLFFSVPFPLCRGCRIRTSEETQIKAILRRVPAFDKLLEKYPRAQVSVRESTCRTGGDPSASELSDHE